MIPSTILLLGVASIAAAGEPGNNTRILDPSETSLASNPWATESSSSTATDTDIDTTALYLPSEFTEYTFEIPTSTEETSAEETSTAESMTDPRDKVTLTLDLPVWPTSSHSIFTTITLHEPLSPTLAAANAKKEWEPLDPFSCPSLNGECFGTIKIRCDYSVSGDQKFVGKPYSIAQCLDKCSADKKCKFFTLTPNKSCYTSFSGHVVAQGKTKGYVAGFKGTCKN
ncbi:uncharacterized protein B0J16DRAFT_164900 [Fusarium flagelliforme]|uniref:uncharacterized protein n=1 Tax=Fusarium flagelliforme TaxID=2675880 RepID=UPI001E8ED102|nr:uncharacterized protein B0J16DRAFT_164900 [Fusarium flagelliforme]KAH7183514.1 hypothetical protein B0J16DRAFT_164900 [Fusarium flagelliforme]